MKFTAEERETIAAENIKLVYFVELRGGEGA